MAGQPVRSEDLGALGGYSALMIVAGLFLTRLLSPLYVTYEELLPKDFVYHCLLLFGVLVIVLGLAVVGILCGTRAARMAGLLSIAGTIAVVLNQFGVISWFIL
jgi:hypothetical protein